MDNDQLLRNILLTGTPRETETFFIAHRSDVNACRALAVACRFCGLEYVRTLAENGAVFDASDVYYWLALLDFTEEQREAYCTYEEDECIEVELTHNDDTTRVFRPLPLEQRMEIVRYLGENSERIHFDTGELLYFSVLCNNREMRLTEVAIPSSVKEIGENFFCECAKLRSVKLPAGIKRIGNNAFSQCYSLKELIIPEGTEEIGDKAFSRCKSLTVVIPASVKTIGSDIFLESYNVTVIVEPNSFAEKYCKEKKFRSDMPNESAEKG
ncbi:MAG: leucine-rich repeat domain-containing protein [Ruminococcaceae bacterium]|nr:leucine-rich repeat domain-containing protein [Oscillospiraceae bacterium]